MNIELFWHDFGSINQIVHSRCEDKILKGIKIFEMVASKLREVMFDLFISTL